MGSAISLPGDVAQALFNEHVTGAEIDSNGTLLLTKLDGTQVESADFGVLIQQQAVSVVASKVNSLKALLQTQGYIPPVGTLMESALFEPPIGWLLCDGRKVSKTTYANLYAVIQDHFGGQEPTVFTLPNIQHSTTRRYIKF